MFQDNPAWTEYQRRRWTRSNARLYLRPDPKLYLQPNQKLYFKPQPYERKDHPDPSAELEELLRLRSELESLKAEIKFRRLLRSSKAFNPNQPRVPGGSREGGQWTSGGGTSGDMRRNDPRVVSDATPDNEWKPGAQYAASRGGRGSVPVRIGGRLVEVEPGQAARLAIAEGRAQDAIRRVRELDPRWNPTPSFRETAEGAIATAEAEVREAEARISELARNGIGPGPFAGESIPARGPGRSYNESERSESRRIFSETGCHTCGIFDAGTPSGNPILDHQPPSAWNPFGRSQRLYPQCLSCSNRQGNWISRHGGRR
jgi:hypothetical protein